MAQEKETHYGPLSGLFGHWQGNKGIDHAPGPDGVDENFFHEDLIFIAAGAVENADSQQLAYWNNRL